MNSDDRAARLELHERVGAEACNRTMAGHEKASTVATVNGYEIRPVTTRFGRLFQLVGTGQACTTRELAEACARKLPTRTALTMLPSYLCPHCQAVSFDLHELRHSYCGRCNCFADGTSG
jgi:hypothetical protein